MGFLEFIKLALGALKTNKVRSILTMLGVIVGVASVILLVSIGTGSQSLGTRQFASPGSNVVFVLPGKVDITRNTGGRPLTPVSKFELNDIRELDRAGGAIKQASPMIQVNGTLTYRGESVTVPIIGVWENLFSIRNLNLAQGKLVTQSDVSRSRKAIVLGAKTAEDLFKSGGNPVGKSLTLNEVRYQVVGILESKGASGFGVNLDEQAYIPLSSALKQFDMTKPSIILVETPNQESVPDAAKLTENILLKHLKKDDFTVIQQTELLSTINQFLGVVTLALGGIASISLLVGGIGIMNIMLVSVTERTREIGLRKAVGATPQVILVQFLIEAVILSLVGGAIGIGLGALGSLLIQRFIQTSITPWSVFLAFGFSALVGIVFGIAPAIRAAHLNPIDALRYE